MYVPVDSAFRSDQKFSVLLVLTFSFMPFWFIGAPEPDRPP